MGPRKRVWLKASALMLAIASCDHSAGTPDPSDKGAVGATVSMAARGSSVIEGRQSTLLRPCGWLSAMTERGHFWPITGSCGND